MRIQLKEKEKNCEKLESKIGSLRKELEKTTIKVNRRFKFKNGIGVFYDILNC